MNSFPPLLLLRDGGDNGAWDPILDLLPGFLDIAVVELPGDGAVTGMSELIAARVRELRLTAPHVVGHSRAGAVALEVASRMPVSGVTAFCPIGFWTRPHAWFTAARAREVRGTRRYVFAGTAAITVPVLLVWGRFDRMIAPADAGRARRRLPQARQLTMPDTGHEVMRDDPVTTAAIMFAWHQRLAGIDVPPAIGSAGRG